MDQMNPASALVPKSGPKDVFLHLLSIVTLYASVISFIGVLWQYINVMFPDPLYYSYTSVLNSMRWSASVLVVMFPVYVFVTWLINKGYVAEPMRREIRVRKWLVYLTLFISAITVIVDVITLVYNLFGGELTAKFFLKILAVLITAAAVFAYYLWDLRKEGSPRNVKVLAWGVSVLVVAAIVGGFFLVGSPAKQRSMNFDSQRVNDLQSIQSEVVYYWQQKQVLPAHLSDLNDSIRGYVVTNDRETNQPYEYIQISSLSFDLCANFNLPSVSDSSPYASKPMPVGDSYNQNWTHGAGHTCFSRTIDPQFTKPITPIAPPIK